jgi:hypothetical protein
MLTIGILTIAGAVVFHRRFAAAIDRLLAPARCDDDANDLGVAFDLEGGRRR